MCGIGGMNLTTKDLKGSMSLDVMRLSHELLLDLEHRGPHATGAAWSDAEGVWYDKAPERARQYVKHLPISPLSRNVILHTRYATGGWAATPKVNDNNHPFSLPGVTGVHNGVLRNHEQMWKGLPIGPETGTDSEVIFAALAYRTGSRCEVLRQIRGDASIAWIETEHPDRLYLARLEGRPLAVARTEAGGVVWASTAAILKSASAAADVPLYKIRNVPEWTYLVIQNGRIRRVDRIRPAWPLLGPEDVEVGAGLDARDLMPKGVRLGVVR